MINSDMNFFAPYQGQKKEEKNKNIYIYSLIAFMVVVIVGSFIYNTVGILLAKNKISFYEEELSKPEVVEKIKVYEELDRQNTALLSYEKQVEEIIQSIESRQVVKVEVLNNISGTLPTEVTINGISIEKEKLSIKGIATSRIAIGELENNLRNLNFVERVHVGSIAGQDKYTFDISCKLKEVEWYEYE